MGIKYTNYVWDTQTDVKGTRLVLLLAYADYAGEDGSSWSSCPGMAGRVRGSEANVRALDKDLQHAHKIIKIPGKGKETPFGRTNLTVVVAPGINCQSYEDLCKQWKIAPLPYKSLPEDNRYGRNPFRLNSTPLLNSSEPPLEFNTPPILDSRPDPSALTINEPSDSFAASAAGGAQAEDSLFFSGMNLSSQENQTNALNGFPANGRSRPRDLIFDAIVEHCFDTDPFNALEVQQLSGSRIGKIASAVRKAYKGILDDTQLAEELGQFATFWATTELAMPQHEDSLLPNFKKWRDEQASKPLSKAAQQAAAAPRRIKTDCHCKNGYVKTPTGMAYCADCWEFPEAVTP